MMMVLMRLGDEMESTLGAKTDTAAATGVANGWRRVRNVMAVKRRMTLKITQWDQKNLQYQ